MPERPTEQDAYDCVGELLDQAADLTARLLTDRAGLSASAGFAINRLCREGPVRLTTLAAKEGISQPAMTQLVTRLERLDLVTRLADPDDGRASLIGITAHGQDVIEERKRTRRERLTELMTTLTPEEECALQLAARVAFPVLHRLAANADAAANGVEPHSSPVAVRPPGSRKVFG